jgi:hypothetical protein
VRRRSLTAVRQLRWHHASAFPHHQDPRRGLGGWRGPVLPLTPPGAAGCRREGSPPRSLGRPRRR